ncbi:MAG: hypothetical protein D6760_13040, partial [Deltaproteobacteria bacterium]
MRSSVAARKSLRLAALVIVGFLLVAAGTRSAGAAPGDQGRAESVLVARGDAEGAGAAQARWSGSGCTRSECHAEIEAIREPSSEMFRRIAERGRTAGDPDGCVVCHGGTPTGATAQIAHRGAPAGLAAEGGPDTFFPDPASPWVSERTCGQCHGTLVAAQWRSLMMTEAGKIQGTTWAFGSLEGYDHRWA